MYFEALNGFISNASNQQIKSFLIRITIITGFKLKWRKVACTMPKLTIIAKQGRVYWLFPFFFLSQIHFQNLSCWAGGTSRLFVFHQIGLECKFFSTSAAVEGLWSRREVVFVNKTENYFLTFAAAWVWRWALRFDLSEKDFSQMGHPYGFSPVCVRMCPFNSHGLEKIFPHWRQRWPEPCVRRCMEYAGMETYTWNIKLNLI